MDLNNIYERLRTAIDKDAHFTAREKFSFKSLLLEQFADELRAQVDEHKIRQTQFADKLKHGITNLKIQLNGN